MTAANGDELHFRSVEGRGVTAPDLQWTGMGTGVIEGGTGRFENASCLHCVVCSGIFRSR